ncbi:MAG TPA: hypothetical protein VM686_16875 [Polyangiaceae bacterium]|jgi:hypothetical protein|nr:hypothetical protein [Polyangiaceae bacterium]
MRWMSRSWFLLVLCSTLVASAQPRKGSKPPAKKEAKEAPAKAEPEPASDKPAEAAPAADKPAEKPSAKPAEPSAADDLGAPPPKQPAGGETKLSPLTPEPDEFPKGGNTPPPVSYDKLLAQIAALRSRVAAITTTLYKSKLRVSVAAEGDDALVSGFAVTLDGGIVYTAPDRFSPSEPQVVYFHAVAPGQHVVGVEVERYDTRNRQYRTFQSSKFTVVVPENQTLEATVMLEDDSDMAEDFPDDQDGEYDLRVRLRAQVAE